MLRGIGEGCRLLKILWLEWTDCAINVEELIGCSDPNKALFPALVAGDLGHITSMDESASQ